LPRPINVTVPVHDHALALLPDGESVGERLVGPSAEREAEDVVRIDALFEGLEAGPVRGTEGGGDVGLRGVLVQELEGRRG
jgi:hypothetical protein